MNLLIISSLLIIFLLWILDNNTEQFKNIGEGKLSYYKRLLKKHIKRPLKYKIKGIHNKLKGKYTKIKKTYL